MNIGLFLNLLNAPACCGLIKQVNSDSVKSFMKLRTVKHKIVKFAFFNICKITNQLTVPVSVRYYKKFTHQLTIYILSYINYILYNLT